MTKHHDLPKQSVTVPPSRVGGRTVQTGGRVLDADDVEVLDAAEPVVRHVWCAGTRWPVKFDPTSGEPDLGGYVGVHTPTGDLDRRLRVAMFATDVVRPSAAQRAARRHVSGVELEVERARWVTVCAKAVISHATNAGSMPPEFLAQAWSVVTG